MSYWMCFTAQVVLLGLLRLVGSVYIMLFYNIVRRETEKAKKKA